MYFTIEWMIALRYLRGRKQEAFISVISWFSLSGIALGVATLIIVMSVMNGFREDLLGRVLGINGHIKIFSVGEKVKSYNKLTVNIQKIDEVSVVAPVVEGQVMLTKDNNNLGVMVRGISKDDLLARSLVSDNIIAGSMQKFGNSDSILIGLRLAQNLGVKVGERVTVISPKGNITIMGSMPRIKSFNVVGMFDVGMYEYDSNMIFMPLTSAQKFFKMGSSVSYLEVFIKAPEKSMSLLKDIREKVGPTLTAVDWKRTNSSFYNAIQVERNVMFLILTLIILVAAFNIISGIIMLVRDKSREIGILRTIGANRGMILRIFFISGASIGTIGTITGCFLGLLFSYNIDFIRHLLQNLTGTELFSAEIYFLSHLPSKVLISEVILVVSMGLFLSFLATVYPSWRAASLNPVDALKSE